MKQINTEQALSILKNHVYSDLHSGLWDQKLWLYANILQHINGVHMGTSPNHRLACYTLDPRETDLICITWHTLFIHISVISKQYDMLKERLWQLKSQYQVPIRISTTDQSLASLLSSHFSSEIQEDSTRYYYVLQKSPSENPPQTIGWFNVSSESWCRVNIDSNNFEEDESPMSNEHRIQQCQDQIQSLSGDFKVITASIEPNEFSLKCLLSHLGFEKLYTEYVVDI